jgi:hypothetical protein
MMRIVAVASIILALLLAHPMLTESPPSELETQLNRVIQDVLKAESAGAQPDELKQLIYPLNSVISLEAQLQNLGSNETQRRAQLFQEINGTLAGVDGKAKQLEVSAAQRTYTSHLVTYSLGAVGAVLAAIASHYTFSLWRRYRAKRVLQFKIGPK